MEERPIHIKSYKRVWKIERILYKLDDRIKLWKPVTLWQLIYFFLAIILVAVIDFNTFLIGWIPELVRYGGIPFAISYYMSKVKHDGKTPHRWFYTIIKYYVSNKRLNRYKPIGEQANIKYSGTCTFRELYNKED